ncbi:MAG: DUF2007 domain-containing protein [Solirubrobacterales bacterium]|nr:DUF2007 domain-containing protein [Solirubrobacterales bacterium]
MADRRASGDDRLDEPVDSLAEARREQARKIDPAYAEGDLVKVGWAPNQPVAELMQGLLLENGIPSMLRRTLGMDVPDFLAAGARDIFVPASGAELARELLAERGAGDG